MNLTIPNSSLPYEAETLIEQSPLSMHDFLGLSLNRLLELFFKPIMQNIRLPAEFLIKGAAFLLLSALVLSLLRESGYRVPIEMTINLGFAALCAAPLSEVHLCLLESTQSWHTYLCGFVPVFSGVLTAQGQPAAATIYDGIFLGVSALMVQVIGTIFLPLVQGYFCLAAAVTLWGNPGAADGVNLLYRGINWLLKILTVLLTSILCLQGIFAGAADQAAGKGVQAMVKLTLPVVGDLALQAAGGVLAGMKLLKGTLAFSAIITILLSFLPSFGLCCGLLLTFWGIATGAKAIGLPKCGAMAEQFGNGVQLLTSVLTFYFFLVFFATLMMLMLGGSA